MEYRIDPYPSYDSVNILWSAAWGDPAPVSLSDMLSRGLGHVCAYEDDIIIGFVNVAWDGGSHAFIVDTCVHPDYRRQDIATRLIQETTTLSRHRGAHWLHVDFEPHLETFYRKCGFSHTAAGLISLQSRNSQHSR